MLKKRIMNHTSSPDERETVVVRIPSLGERWKNLNMVERSMSMLSESNAWIWKASSASCDIGRFQRGSEACCARCVAMLRAIPHSSYPVDVGVRVVVVVPLEEGIHVELQEHAATLADDGERERARRGNVEKVHKVEEPHLADALQLEARDDDQQHHEQQLDGQPVDVPNVVAILPAVLAADHAFEDGREVAVERERADGRPGRDAAKAGKRDAQPRAEQEVRVDVVRVEIHVEPARVGVEEAALAQLEHALAPLVRRDVERKELLVRLARRTRVEGGDAKRRLVPLAEEARLGVAVLDDDGAPLAVDPQERVVRVDGGHRARLKVVEPICGVDAGDAARALPRLDPPKLKLGRAQKP
eukprot:3402610-Prymnesium_polylepis.1